MQRAMLAGKRDIATLLPLPEIHGEKFTPQSSCSWGAHLCCRVAAQTGNTIVTNYHQPLCDLFEQAQRNHHTKDCVLQKGSGASGSWEGNRQWRDNGGLVLVLSFAAVWNAPSNGLVTHATLHLSVSQPGREK